MEFPHGNQTWPGPTIAGESSGLAHLLAGAAWSAPDRVITFCLRSARWPGDPLAQ
jgi:hypothetical protein